MSRFTLLGHYGLTLYRSVARRRLYVVLNVVGLAVGIAVFIVLMLDVRFETSFDRWIPDAGNIYRYSTVYTLPGQAPDRMAPAGGKIPAAFRADYPQAGQITRMFDQEQPVLNGDVLGTEHTDYVDGNFFAVLHLPLVAGAWRTALSNPGDVVVTAATARKYFGGTDVLGRPLTLILNGRPAVHRVTGVLADPPANSTLKLGVLAPITPDIIESTSVEAWGSSSTYVYVRFRSLAQARMVASDLTGFVGRHFHGALAGSTLDLSKMMHLELTPITRLRFADLTRRWTMTPSVDARLVYALAIVAALTLAVAILNYLNLATAVSGRRAREIALRKVMGATRLALMAQLLIEAVALAAGAVALGLALAEVCLPMTNALSGSDLRLSYLGSDGVLPLALGLTLMIGLGAGAYPAMLLSGFAPAPVLASARAPGGGRKQARLRDMLIGAQFVVAVTVTIGALIVAAQAQFIRRADRGFQREGLIFLENMASSGLMDRQNQILDAMRGVPGVVSAAASIRQPGIPVDYEVLAQRPGAATPPLTLSFDLVSKDYLQTYGARLIAGRMFDDRHGEDDVGGPDRGPLEAASRGVDVVLNESAARALGFNTPAAAVGQRVFTSQVGKASLGAAVPIIGVVRDIQLGSPRSRVAPVVYRYDSRPFGGLAVGAIRFAGVDQNEMMARLRAAWRRQAPMVPFLARPAEEALRDYYIPDEQRARLFTAGSVLAVALGCVGLYGLAAFNAARRVREVGIRKTLGASSLDILQLLLRQILRPVLIANLIAWPVAWLAMRSWLAGFDQRIALSPLYFLAASVLALAVASLTVIAQSLSLARAEPAKALRHE